MENNTNINLISFLQELTTSLESGKLSNKQILRISEFFMSYQFQEIVTKNDKDNNNNDEDNWTNLDFNIKELIQFLFLGWYVHCVILKGKMLQI